MGVAPPKQRMEKFEVSLVENKIIDKILKLKHKQVLMRWDGGLTKNWFTGTESQTSASSAYPTYWRYIRNSIKRTGSIWPIHGIK